MRDEVTTNRRNHPINWPMTLFMFSFHVGAAVALFHFSWPALGVAVLLLWMTGSLGIGIGYHRLLTHRGFKTSKPVEYFLTLCGALALEGGPIPWCANHRLHHAHAERDGDPHSPRHGFWWSHMGWITNGVSDHNEVEAYTRTVPDLAQDRFHQWISRWNYLPQLILCAILYWAGGWPFVWWGICVRVVFSWHATCFVNSAAHVWGRRRFETPDDSRNNWWVALVTFGEGWHNNHHAHPAAARHGLAWYEIDINWYGIWALEKLGLIEKVRLAKLPKSAAVAEPSALMEWGGSPTDSKGRAMENRTYGSIPDTSGAENSYRIYRKIFDRVLSPLPAGKLRVVLPTGEERVYGLKAPGPEATLTVLNPVFFKKCILYGEVGLGESYVDGDWDTDDVISVLSWFIINLENAPAAYSSKRRLPLTDLFLVLNRLRHKARANHTAGARRNISEHYDLGNDFYKLFLDPGMTYSCAYFNSPDQSLEAAQTEKYNRLCRKLKINSSDQVLEIGGGWGGFAVHAARNYGCRVTSITLSEEQLKYAKERAAAEGLSNQIEFQLTDYRNVTGKFDKIVSIEMIEAVGHEYFKSFFKKCHELLNRYGLLGVQAITCPDSRYDSHRKNVTWMQKHIFPGGLLPSIGVMNKAINETGDLQLHDLEEMAPHYARTVATWRENFNHKLESVLAQGFSERFIRKWNYYLLNCEAVFRTRNISVVQAIYSRPNNLTI